MGGDERKEKEREEWERGAVYQWAAQEAALAWKSSRGNDQ